MSDVPQGIDSQPINPQAEALDPTNVDKLELYRNLDYVSLYRYENPNIPYDSTREGSVSKSQLIGAWFTNSLADLKTYTLMRIKGQRGGRFVVVRVKRDDLDKYDATKLPETREMDIEAGNYIIPSEVAQSSRVEVEGIFKDEWEGRKNLDSTQWEVVGDYINRNLSDAAIVARLLPTAA